MAALYTVSIGGRIKAADVNQLVNAMVGAAGTEPISFTGISNSSSYAVLIKNAGAGGKGFAVQNSSGVTILTADNNGLQAYISAASGLQELVGRTFTQTLTGKTYQSAVLTNAAGSPAKLSAAALVLARSAASLTAGTTLTIPSPPAGNTFPVTGGGVGTVITTISATAGDIQAGFRIRLHFDGNNGVVKDSGNIKVVTWFYAKANAMLELEYDGTNWREVNRGGDYVPNLRLTGSTTLINGGDTTVAFGSISADSPDTYGLVNGGRNQVSLFCPGWWHVKAGVTWPANNKKKSLWVDRNTVQYIDGVSQTMDSSTAVSQQAYGLIYSDGTNTTRVRANAESDSISLTGGDWEVRFLGR